MISLVRFTLQSYSSEAYKQQIDSCMASQQGAAPCGGCNGRLMCLIEAGIKMVVLLLCRSWLLVPKVILVQICIICARRQL